MENVFVVPAKDAEGKALRVPDPATGIALPAEGAWKPRSQYWLRRLRHADVTEGTPPAPASDAPAPAAYGFTSRAPSPLAEPAVLVEPAAPVSSGK